MSQGLGSLCAPGSGPQRKGCGYGLTDTPSIFLFPILLPKAIKLSLEPEQATLSWYLSLLSQATVPDKTVPRRASEPWMKGSCE